MRQATTKILKLFEVYLGAYEDDLQTLPFRQILALTDTKKYDQDFLYEITKQLKELESVGLSGTEAKHVKDFRIMAHSLLEWPEQTAGTVLYSPGRHLDELLKDPELKVKVNHPTFECYTLPIKKSPDMDTFWIAKESYWQAFRSNPPSNVLYLDDPGYKKCDFIEFVYGRERLKARYQRISLDDPILGFPASFYHRHNALSGCFFKEVKIQSQNEKSGVVKDLYINAYSDVSEFANYETVGWLNPLIMTFDVYANDIPYHESSVSRAKEMIQTFSNPELVIHIEPHINYQDSSRIELLKRLSQRQLSQRSQQSIMEYLLWGTQDDDAWQAFFILDRFNGEFLVEGFGRTRMRPLDERPGNPRLYWKPPEHLASNSLWLKDVALRQALHIQEDTQALPPDHQLQPSVMPGHSSSRGYKRFEIEHVDSTMPVIISILKAFPKSQIEDASQKTLESMLTWSTQFLEDIFGLTGADTGLYMGEGSYQIEGKTVQFDELYFLEEFCPLLSAS